MNAPGPRAAAPAISVIVPVYNVAAYLRECLDSLAAQDLEEAIEIIVVDDASTDASVAVCRDWLAQGYDGLLLLENAVNRGVSVARNRGLEAASGTYFAFVDPDDALPADGLSSLYRAAEAERADIVKGNNTIVSADGESDARYNVGKRERIDGADVLTTLYRHEKLRGHPWGKLFRRDRLGHFRFTEGVRMAQDLFYCSEVFAHARSLVLVDRVVYRYRNHGGGSTGRKFASGSYLDWLDAVEASGRFARARSQRRAHRNLLVRTLNQLAREARKLPAEQARAVLAEIERRCAAWDIRLPRLLFADRLGPRGLARYVKLRHAIRQTRDAAGSGSG